MKALYHNSLQKIATIVGGELVGDSSQTVTSLSTDSRLVDRGSLFIPLVGENFDGHTFIDQLCKEHSIAAYLTAKELSDEATPAVKCHDTLKALGALSADYRSRFSIPFIGVTGTNGKTTTKELVVAALSKSYCVHKNSKNYNNEIGVPFTLLDLNEKHTAAVIELGMNHSGEIVRLTQIVKPDSAIITNVGAGHLEFLHSLENVARAKAEIFESMQPHSIVYICRDTQCYEILEQAALVKGLQVKSYGLDSSAEISPDYYQLYEQKIELTYKDQLFSVELYGVHNVVNILAAIAVAEDFGVALPQIAKGLAGFKNAAMRGQILKGRCTVVNDAYNSNPLSLSAALQSIGMIYNKATSNRRLIAVLGDMKELGADAPALHKGCGAAVMQYGFDSLYTYGDLGSKIAVGAILSGMNKDMVHSYTEKEKLIEDLLNSIEQHDVVLIKGSRSMKMEEVAEALLR